MATFQGVQVLYVIERNVISIQSNNPTVIRIMSQSLKEGADGVESVHTRGSYAVIVMKESQEDKAKSDEEIEGLIFDYIKKMYEKKGIKIKEAN